MCVSYCNFLSFIYLGLIFFDPVWSFSPLDWARKETLSLYPLFLWVVMFLAINVQHNLLLHSLFLSLSLSLSLLFCCTVSLFATFWLFSLQMSFHWSSEWVSEARVCSLWRESKGLRLCSAAGMQYTETFSARPELQCSNSLVWLSSSSLTHTPQTHGCS